MATPTRVAPRWRTAAALIGVAVAASGACTDRPPNAPPGVAVVRRVVDGDTLVVRIGGRDQTVRLIGIDTPETHHPERPVECHGPEAADRLAQLAPPGTTVSLARDEELYDVHGRLLAYVRRVDDGLDLAQTMAAEGHADALRIAPNTATAVEVSAAVAAARRGRLGLWGHCAGPHEPADAPPGPATAPDTVTP